MATDIEKLIPDPAKQDLAEVNALWDLMVEKVKELAGELTKAGAAMGGLGGGKTLKDFSTAVKSAAENQQKLTNQTSNYLVLSKELAAAENRLTKSLSDENKQIIALNETRKQYNYQVKQQVIAENAAFGSLTHLRAELNRTKAEWSALGVEVRQSDIGKAIQLQISRFDTEVKRLEGEMGVFGRNVVNYQGALAGAMGVQGQFQQLLRELPNAGISARTFLISITNNITYFTEAIQLARMQGNSWGQIMGAMKTSMFGVVGIINMAVLALTVFGTSIIEASASTTAAEEAVEKYKNALNEAGRSANRSAMEEQTRLQILNEVATDVTANIKARIAATTEMQELYPDVLGNYTKEAIMAGEAADAIERVAEAILKRAAATAAEKRVIASGEKILDLEQARKKAISEQAQAYNDLKRAKDAEAAGGVPGTVPSSGNTLVGTYELRAALAESNLKEISKAIEDEKALQKQFATLASAAAGEALGLGGDGPGETGGSSPGKATKRLKDLSKEQFELQTADMRRQMEINKMLAEDDSRSYSDRIDALEKYYALKRRLILDTAEYEKSVGNKTLVEQEIIDGQAQQALIDLTNETLNIEAKASLKSLEHEREVNEQKKKNLADLTEFAKKQNGQRIKDEEEAEDKRMALISKVVSYAIQASNVLREISRSHHTQNMEELNRQDEENDRSLEREIARINRSTLSKQEKEEKIREAEAKSEIERKRIERERREAEQRQAAFDRDMAIFQMMLNMFVGMAKEIGKKGAIGIITAAAIAAFMGGMVAMAGRLTAPKYAEGIDSKPTSGPAWVGDGGEPELITLPSGKSFFSPATDTLMNLPAGTSVTPMSDLIEESNGMLTPKLLNSIMLKSGGNTARMERLMAKKLDEVRDAIESKPVYRSTFSNGYVREIMYKGNTEVKFIKRRL